MKTADVGSMGICQNDSDHFLTGSADPSWDRICQDLLHQGPNVENAFGQFLSFLKLKKSRFTRCVLKTKSNNITILNDRCSNEVLNIPVNYSEDPLMETSE